MFIRKIICVIPLHTPNVCTEQKTWFQAPRRKSCPYLVYGYCKALACEGYWSEMGGFSWPGKVASTLPGAAWTEFRSVGEGKQNGLGARTYQVNGFFLSFSQPWGEKRAAVTTVAHLPACIGLFSLHIGGSSNTPGLKKNCTGNSA